MAPHLGKLSMVAALPLTMLLTYGAPVPQTGTAERRAPERLTPAAPRPDIVPRPAWRAGRAVEAHGTPSDTVRAVFLHHTNIANDYACGDVPGMLRALQSDHIRGNGWDDVGYNFLVDRCGTIYEGRKGSVQNPVTGAHTKGFNRHTLGIAAIGNFDAEPVPKPMLRSVAALIAWKLRPDADPRGTVELRSNSSESRVPKGESARFPRVAAHRDAYQTDCPGQALYGRLPWLRKEAERLREARPSQPREVQGQGRGLGRSDRSAPLTGMSLVTREGP